MTAWLCHSHIYCHPCLLAWLAFRGNINAENGVPLEKALAYIADCIACLILPFFRVWEGKNGTFFVSPKKSQHYSKGGLPKISKLIPKTPYFLLQCVTWTFTANIGSTLYFLLIILILTKRLLHLNTGLFYFFEKVVQLLSFYGTIPMGAVLYQIIKIYRKCISQIICAVSLCAPLDPFVIWVAEFFGRALSFLDCFYLLIASNERTNSWHKSTLARLAKKTSKGTRERD